MAQHQGQQNTGGPPCSLKQQLGALCHLSSLKGFPGGSVVKTPPANAGDVGLIPGSGRSPGEGDGTPLQCSCLGMDRGAWWAAVHGVAKSRTGLSN